MRPLFSNTTICVHLLCREKTENTGVVFCNTGLQNKNQSPLSLFNLSLKDLNHSDYVLYLETNAMLLDETVP